MYVCIPPVSAFILSILRFSFVLCIQRPSARELLKHKFVRMAKKTNYLTELIERHERWRAEGGERHEEEQEENDNDL